MLEKCLNITNEIFSRRSNNLNIIHKLNIDIDIYADLLLFR